jgi:hypothetical protein
MAPPRNPNTIIIINVTTTIIITINYPPTTSHRT